MSDIFADAATQGAAGPTVIDVTAANFEQSVIAESQTRPVVVDFWAPWCGPCQQLGPVLEEEVSRLGGRILLAKVNTEAEQQLAAAFGISSIPLVVAIRDGQIVDQFAGLRPADQIREWLGQIVPSRADELVQQAALESEFDPPKAIEAYRAALAEDASLDAAKVGLAKCLVEVNQREEAGQLIEELERRGFLEPEAEQVKAALSVPVADNDDVQSARAAYETSPDDLALALNLAEALAGSEKNSDALELALEIVQKDRVGVGAGAKELMVRIFEKLGSGSPLVSEYRKKLATLLY